MKKIELYLSDAEYYGLVEEISRFHKAVEIGYCNYSDEERAEIINASQAIPYYVRKGLEKQRKEMKECCGEKEFPENKEISRVKSSFPDPKPVQEKEEKTKKVEEEKKEPEPAPATATAEKGTEPEAKSDSKKEEEKPETEVPYEPMTEEDGMDYELKSAEDDGFDFN